jgi:hypothetical protein
MLTRNPGMFQLAFNLVLPELHNLILGTAMNIEYGLRNDMFVFPDE